MSNFRIYNPTLCPDLWDEYQHLDPRVRVNLLRLAYDFYKKTKFPAPIIDVYLMGSIASYNWTPDSDADVHIIVDYNQLQMPPETAFKMVKTAGAQWNAEHNILVKGHKVELNLQDVNEIKPHVMGIYSLVKDQWVRKPSNQPPAIDKASIQVQYKAMEKYVQSAMNSGNRETMKAAKEYLDSYRQYGLDTAGELSQQNIVFKILRSKGIIKNLKDAITLTYDREMSVREVGQKDIKAKFPLPSALYKGDPKLKMMTLDNLKSMRDKAARMIKYHSRHPDDSPQAQKAMEDYRMYQDEIRKRLNYINSPVAEGYGSGIPEKDRLKIKNTDGSTRRWQIRSKDAPKTPKMTEEEVVPVKEDIAPGITKLPPHEPRPRRGIDLHPPEPLEGVPPEVKQIIAHAEKVLDKKYKQGETFVTVEYMQDLLDDLMASYLEGLPPSDMRYIGLQRAIIMWLANDYDIRYKGNRLLEVKA